MLNKLDLLDEEERSELLVGQREAIGVSAATGEGVPALLDAAVDKVLDSEEGTQWVIFTEFKPTYGDTLVTGWAYIWGMKVGVLGNNRLRALV